MAVGPSVTVTDSTIAHNRSVGGGDGEVGDGAGIYVDDEGVLLMTNSTLTDNAALNNGGAIFGEAGGRAQINSATIVRNFADFDDDGQGSTGGIHLVFASFEVINSIIMLNTIGLGNFPGDYSDCGGTAFGGVANPNLTLDPTADCGPGEEIVDFTSHLGLLQDNGGPTHTIALQPDSLAIGAAEETLAPPLDQRGVERLDPDLGAFELR